MLNLQPFVIHRVGREEQPVGPNTPSFQPATILAADVKTVRAGNERSKNSTFERFLPNRPWMEKRLFLSDKESSTQQSLRCRRSKVRQRVVAMEPQHVESRLQKKTHH